MSIGELWISDELILRWIIVMVYSVRVLHGCQWVWDWVFQVNWKLTSMNTCTPKHTCSSKVVLINGFWLMYSFSVSFWSMQVWQQERRDRVSTIKIIFHLILWNHVSAFLISYLDRREATRCKSTLVHQNESNTNKTRPE